MDTEVSEELARSLVPEDMDAVLIMDKFIDSADKGFVRRAAL